MVKMYLQISDPFVRADNLRTFKTVYFKIEDEMEYSARVLELNMEGFQDAINMMGKEKFAEALIEVLELKVNKENN